MHILDNYSQNFLTTNQEREDTQREQFKITKVSLVGNKLNITLQNSGQIPLNITRLWVQDTTANSISKYEINSADPPSQTITNIGMSLPPVVPTDAYDMKLVTSRGNSQDFFMSSASSAPILLQLFVLPSTLPSGFTTTVLLSVTNNMTNNAVLTNVTPSLNVIQGGASSSCSSQAQPTSYQTLQNGGTAFFQWTCTVTGNVGSTVSYNATILNAYHGNFVMSTASIAAVPSAGQSQTALSAQGLSSLGFNDNVLVLHQETTPSGLAGYEMYSAPPDTTGKVIRLDLTNPVFYTNNDTSMSPVAINSGKWNGTLRYFSSPLPSTILVNASMIFHFENYTTTGPKVHDSTTSLGTTTNDLTVNNNPSWSPTGGVNGSGGFTFTGSQYLDNTITSRSADDLSTPATISGWFETSGSTSKQVILRFGSNGDTAPFYEISLDNAGHVLSRFAGASNSLINTCQTTGTYANSNWHHFVAVETTSGSILTCNLYIDNNGNGNGETVGPTQTSCSSCTNHPTGKWSIGRDDSSSGINYFKGNVDDVIIWNGNALTSSQAIDLYHTDYGTASHTITFTLDIVDQYGNLISHVNSGSISNIPLPFKDSYGTYPNTPSSTAAWGQTNFTISGSQITVQPGQKVKFKMTWIPPSSGQLYMKLDLDNNLISGPTSMLETPVFSAGGPLPGYWTVSFSNPQVSVYNKGPYQAWLTINSRIVFETLDGTQAYASWFSSFVDSDNKISQDSPLIPVGGSQTLGFAVPCQQPTDGGGGNNCLTSSSIGNTYRMYVYLNGYDQKGNIFVGTEYFGPVKMVN